MMQSLHHNHNHLLHPFSNQGNPSFPRITPSRISYKPLHTSYKPLQISSALKKEDLLPNLSDPLFTSFWNNHPVVAVYKQVEAIILKNESLQNSIFNSIGPFLIWIYPKLPKLFSIISFKDQVDEFVVENDVIVFTHNGEEIAGFVKKIGEKKTAVETECGLLYYDNADFNKLPLYNVTSRSDDKEVMWGIHAVVEVKCELGEIDEVIKKIQSLLDKREMVKENSKHNLVKLKSVAPRLLILVNAFVKPSELKDSKFKSYQDIRRELLVEIREACEIKEDVIVFTHNGEEIAGLVKKIGDKKTAVETECGLLYYDNADFNKLPLYNVTSRSDDKEIMWGIHAVVEVKCELGEIDEVIKKIQSLLDKREMVKENSKHNLVKLKSVAPRLLILVNAFVKPSKLKYPKFKSYQDIRREFLVEIREACEIKEDVIVFTHNGEEIAGLVKKIGDKKTAVETECGLLYYDNADFNKLPLYNVTSRSDDKEVMWGIHAVVEVKCELGEIEEVIKKIQSLLDKREMVKENSKHNLVKLKSVAPRLLILVKAFVKPSKLKDPTFKSYQDIRRELLLEIREACET